MRQCEGVKRGSGQGNTPNSLAKGTNEPEVDTCHLGPGQGGVHASVATGAVSPAKGWLLMIQGGGAREHSGRRGWRMLPGRGEMNWVCDTVCQPMSPPRSVASSLGTSRALEILKPYLAHAVSGYRRRRR